MKDLWRLYKGSIYLTHICVIRFFFLIQKLHIGPSWITSVTLFKETHDHRNGFWYRHCGSCVRSLGRRHSRSSNQMWVCIRARIFSFFLNLEKDKAGCSTRFDAVTKSSANKTCGRGCYWSPETRGRREKYFQHFSDRGRHRRGLRFVLYLPQFAVQYDEWARLPQAMVRRAS